LNEDMIMGYLAGVVFAAAVIAGVVIGMAI